MLKKFIRSFLENKNFLRGNINKNDRSGALHKAWGYIFTNHIIGDYVEFGIYQGESFVSSFKNYSIFRKWLKEETRSPESWRQEVAKNYMGHTPKFHGLDTFECMPENKEDNLRFSQGTYQTNLHDVTQKCLRSKIKTDQFQLYKGLFSETKSQLQKNIKKAAIVNIDCDLYISTVDALNIIEPFLQQGTVIMFDDYNAYASDNNQGERKAFKEFCQQSRYNFEPWFSYQYAGQAFLCTN